MEERTAVSVMNLKSSRDAASDVARHALVGLLDAVVRPRGDGGEPGDGPGALFVAVVHTIDTVRFVAVSTLRAELLRQLAHYAAQRGPDALRAADADRLRALLADGEPEAAVAHYFATVGQRWDEEWLVTARVDVDALADPVLTLRRSAATGTVHLPVARERPAADPRSAAPPPSPSVLINR